MMIPVFSKRLQFVTKMLVNTVFRLGARGANPAAGSVESGDVAELLIFLLETREGIGVLDEMTKAEFDYLYNRRFRGKTGLNGYSTKALLADLLKNRRAHFVSNTGGSEECSNFSLGLGSAATSGVERFTPRMGPRLCTCSLAGGGPTRRRGNDQPIAGIFLRGGAGSGTAVHAVKCLQTALSGCNPGESANEAGLVREYGLPFNTKPPEMDQVRKPHPCINKVAGVHLSLDEPHETNRGPPCRATFGGLKTCDELGGVNLNPHKQNHIKKKRSCIL